VTEAEELYEKEMDVPFGDLAKSNLARRNDRCDALMAYFDYIEERRGTGDGRCGLIGRRSTVFPPRRKLKTTSSLLVQKKKKTGNKKNDKKSKKKIGRCRWRIWAVCHDCCCHLRYGRRVEMYGGHSTSESNLPLKPNESEGNGRSQEKKTTTTKTSLIQFFIPRWVKRMPIRRRIR
jgi:hypothetical protein